MNQPPAELSRMECQLILGRLAPTDGHNHGTYPRCSNEVFFSNRSAAFASLEQWEEALADAKKAVALKPRWAKAHQRVATAFMGLQLYSDAKEALEQAQKLEPDNQVRAGCLYRVCEARGMGCGGIHGRPECYAPYQKQGNAVLRAG